MSALGELLSFAEEEEARKQKEELEKRLFPLWLVNYAISRFNGTKAMNYEDFLQQTLSTEPVTGSERSTDDIMGEFMPIIEHSRRKGG